MANVFSPNGFVPVRRLDGAPWTGQLTQRLIAAANTNKFNKGDPVISLTTGYIDGGAGINPASLPTQGILGIFWGCELPMGSQGSPWQPNYPGTAQSADSKGFIITDPNVVFRVWVGTGASSAAGGPAVLADIGANFNFRLGTGNASSGISGAYLDYATLATTATLPFTLVGLVQDPPGMNGADITTAGNFVEVVMNQQAYSAGRSGI